MAATVTTTARPVCATRRSSQAPRAGSSPSIQSSSVAQKAERVDVTPQKRHQKAADQCRRKRDSHGEHHRGAVERDVGQPREVRRRDLRQHPQQRPAENDAGAAAEGCDDEVLRDERERLVPVRHRVRHGPPILRGGTDHGRETGSRRLRWPAGTDRRRWCRRPTGRVEPVP